MTHPTEAPREALPEPLKVVAWLDPDCLPLPPTQSCLVYAASGPRHWRRDALVRLTDAQSALESERQAHAAEVERLRADAERLDWLEAMVNKNGALHLHDGGNPYGLGLGLRPGWNVRTLRAAIDAARQTTREQP